MQAVELTLLSYTYEKDSIGQQTPKTIKKVIPIIKQTSIMHEEFYEANEQGFKPEARFVISSLNYNGESDLIYMGVKYSIIRTTVTNPDELALICERKIGDVN